MKYIVVTGGVVSGLGKGITISSIGRLLKANGLRVTSIKIDPYLNTDAGTMSPFEHGETFVLDDGGETDLDLGNYERFLDLALTRDHNITTGKVYAKVLARERKAALEVLHELGLRPQHVLVRGVVLAGNVVAAGKGQRHRDVVIRLSADRLAAAEAGAP